MSTPTHDDVFACVVNDMMMELHPLAHSTTTIHRLLVNNIDSPVLTAIQHLFLSNLDTSQMGSLLPALEKMINLTSLALPHCDVSPAQLKFLFTECTALSKLQSFHLSHAEELMSQDLMLLSQSTTLTNLTSLNFNHCRHVTASRFPTSPATGDGFDDFGTFSGGAPKPMGGSSGLIALLSSPVVKNVTHLNLNATYIEDPIVPITIATSPHLSNLVSLELAGCKLHADAVAAFAASTTLINLTHLSLFDGNTDFGDELFSQLFSPPSPLATKLQSLKLEDARITDSSLELLNKASPHLTELMLKACHLPDFDAVAFIATHMQNLAKLDLSHCEIGDDGYVALAESTTLTNLRELHLNWNGAEPESIVALVNSPVMANLTHLELTCTHEGPEVLTAIAQSPSMSNLQHLEFSSNWACDAGDEAVVAFAQSTTLTNLTWLDLGHNVIGEEGIEALFTSPVVSKLKYLDLQHTCKANIAATLAAPSSTLYSLTELRLWDCELDKEDVLQLLATPNLDQLDVLVIHVNYFNDPSTKDAYKARFALHQL